MAYAGALESHVRQRSPGMAYRYSSIVWCQRERDRSRCHAGFCCIFDLAKGESKMYSDRALRPCARLQAATTWMAGDLRATMTTEPRAVSPRGRQWHNELTPSRRYYRRHASLRRSRAPRTPSLFPHTFSCAVLLLSSPSSY